MDSWKIAHMDWGMPATIFIALVIFFVLAMGALTVLWTALPFSVFGIKGIIKELGEEVKKTNRLIEALLKEVSSMKKTEEKERPPETFKSEERQE